MKRKDYVADYLDAYKAMKAAAIEKMKDYGKTLDVREVIRQRIIATYGEENEELLEDSFYEQSYACVFVGKHGDVYQTTVSKVRYNDNKEDLEVFLEEDNGCFSDWFDSFMVEYDRDAIYMTVFDFLK